MNEQDRRREWIESLVGIHGERAVAAVIGFDAVEDFARWRQSQVEIDDLDVALAEIEVGPMPSSE